MFAPRNRSGLMPNGNGSVSPDGRRSRGVSPAARHLASLALYYVALAVGIAALQRAYRRGW